MRFGVLGPVELRSDTGGPLRLTRHKQRLLLAVLMLQPDRFVTIDELIDQLWGADPPASALANLHSYVAQLRRLLDDEHADESSRVETHDRSYRLRAYADELDHTRFERLLDEGRAALGGQHPDLAAQRLTAALGLWRGEVVGEGITLPDALRPQAARLERLRIETQERLFDARLDLRHHHLIESELTLLTNKHPHREHLWAQLMLARYRCGRQADALAAYRDVRDILDRELGIEPGTELRELQQRILRSDNALFEEQTMSSAVSPDGGAVSIEPRESDHAPDLAGTNSIPVPRQLPPDVIEFAGRESELQQLLDDATSQQAVVVDGFGGIGKTTLVVRAAHLLAEQYPDGQLFVDLQGFSPDVRAHDAGEALAELLRAIGHDTRTLPESTPARAALWRSSVADRRLLVVLDNAAAPDQVEPLIPAASGCLVLITSRRRLDLAQTRTLSLEVLSDDDAEQLFTDIVGAQRLDGEPGSSASASEIVHLCGHLPLAIRLVATRLRDRPARSIADQAARLRETRARSHDLETDQRGVTPVFDQSYDQLDEEQQRLFRLLALHPGPEQSTAAAAALAGCDTARADALLQQLIDDRLVQEIAVGRFRLHDLLRSYAANRTQVDDDERLRTEASERLTAWYLHTADAAARVLDTGYREQTPIPPEQGPAYAPKSYEEAIDWFQTERRNLTAVVRAAAEAGRHRQTIQLAHALYKFWYLRGYSDDFINTEHIALDSARRLADPHAEAMAMKELGTAYGRAGRFSEALSYTEQACALWRDLGEQHNEKAAEINRGIIAWHSGRWHDAEKCFRRVLEFRHIHDIATLASVHNNLGKLLHLTDRFAEARQHLTDAVDQHRSRDEPGGEAMALTNLGALETTVGDYAAATAYLEQAHEIARRIRHRAAEGDALTHLGDLHTRTHDAKQAIADHRQAIAISREIADAALRAQALNGLGEAHLAVGLHDDALLHHRAVLASGQHAYDPVEEARAHRGVGYALLAAGNPSAGREHLARAIECYTELGLGQAEEIRDRLR